MSLPKHPKEGLHSVSLTSGVFPSLLVPTVLLSAHFPYRLRTANPITWMPFDGLPNKLTNVVIMKWISFFSSSCRWVAQVQRDETSLLKVLQLGRRQTCLFVFLPCCMGMPWTSVSEYTLHQRGKLFPGLLWLKEVVLSERHWNSESEGALSRRWFSQPLVFIFFLWESWADFKSPLEAVKLCPLSGSTHSPLFPCHWVLFYTHSSPS